MIRPPIRLASPTARALAASFIMDAAPDGCVVEFWPEDIRSEAQSRLMHSMADDLSEQVPYMGMKLTRDQWKRFATAKLKKDTIIFDCDEFGQPNPQAGLIVLGAETRRARKSDVKAITDWFYWFGAQHGVVWTHEKAKVAQLEEMRR